MCLFITQELRGFLLVSTTPTILISISNEFSRSVSLILIVIYETGCGSARISSTENQIYHPSVHNWTMLHHYVGSASDSVPNGSVPIWNETWIVLSTRTMICRFYSRNLLFFLEDRRDSTRKTIMATTIANTAAAIFSPIDS